MIRSRALLVACVAAGLAALTGPAQAGITEIPAKIIPITPPIASGTYPGVDYGRSTSPTDDRYAKTTWRIVKQTGNCCESYLTTTSTGRLLDFGGTYVNYSDDRGVTWRQVQPLTPLVNGEGAIVAAPGGDVLGVGWDPYSGDHLQTYKFEADTGQWLYTEMPLHQPFYDREWISVVPGPVTVDGTTYPYVSLIKGGYPTKEFWYLSTDGLNYTEITSKMLDQMLNGRTVQGALPTSSGGINDWGQPNSNGGMTALGGGGSLASPDSGDEWGLFDGTDASWSAYRLPDGSQPTGRFQVDSAGRVHNLVPTAGRDGFDYRVSGDGGKSWKATHLALPEGFTVEEYDFRANRSAGVAAVALRASGPKADQDLVFKLDITRDAPRLIRFYNVGLGDLDATGGVGNDVRFDFESVTVFGDGKVAVAFLDSTTGTADDPRPAIAIEGDTVLGGRIPPPPPDVPPALGTPYVTYHFDGGDEGWTASGVPTWTRSAPGASGGADDPATASYGMEGPTRYVDNADASLTSPAISAPAGATVLQFWIKTDTEEGFDGVAAEWTADGTTWQSLGQFTGRSTGYPGWQQVTLGFTSPGGDIRVRFHFTSDTLCSALTPACGDFTGARVDEVVVGSAA